MKKEHLKYQEQLSRSFFASHTVSTRTYHHPHIHTNLEILLPCSDNVICRMDDRICPVPRNHLMILNHGDLHWFYLSDQELYDRYVFYFSPSFLPLIPSPGINLLDCFYLRRDNYPTPLPIPQEALCEFFQLADRLVYYSRPEQACAYGVELYQKTLLIQLLLKVNEFYRDYHGPNLFTEKDIPEKNTIYNIIDYIHMHYQESLTIDSLSARFFISKTRLYEIFPLITGLSPGNYLLKFRLSKAKELLAAGFNVELAGQQCGFINLSHFSRIFKLHCGISPKQYQISVRSSVEHP